MASTPRSLTGPEAVGALVLAALGWSVLEAVLHVDGSRQSAGQPFLFAVGAVLTALNLAHRRAQVAPPWAGPFWLRYLLIRDGLSFTGAPLRWLSFAATRALEFSAVALVAVAVSSMTAVHDHELVSDLRAHGVAATATVTHVSRTYGHSNHYLNDVTVDVATPSGTESSKLGVLSTVPWSIRVGDTVAIVRDPQHPSHVLLTSQLHQSYLGGDLASVAAFGGFVAFGLFAAFKGKPRTDDDSPLWFSDRTADAAGST